MNPRTSKKWKRCCLSTLVVGSLVISTAALAQRGGSQTVLDLDRRFVQETLAANPTYATVQGYHDHKGAVLDNELDDYSPGGIKKSVDLYRKFLTEVNGAVVSGKLSMEDRGDLEIIRLQCESALLDLEDVQSHRHNPTLYVELIGNALYEPSVLEYAPLEKRFQAIISRLEKLPALVSAAQQNLVSAPAIWVKVADEENEGDINLVDQELRAKVPANLKDRYNRAAANALASLRGFHSFLTTTLNKHPYDWQLGPKFYAEKFKLTLATGDTPRQTLHDADAELARIRENMRTQAGKVYTKYFRGQPPPSDLNMLVSRVLDKVAQQHTTPESYFSDAKHDLASASQFVEGNHLLSLPAGDNLQVIPTPEFMRGIYGVGGFAPAPALEPKLGAFYWITPFSKDMNRERIESKLREYNRWGLEILTIHEAMPGHYVQAEYANAIQPQWRGVLRQLYGNVPYVEGWAVYATQVMIETGFDASPEMQLTFGKQMLRVVSNTILDIRLQTMGMTDQQALDLMIQQTFQEKEEAEKKLQRAKLSSCQLPTYFVGWRSWDRLRSAYRAKQGSKFMLAAFHERALREGALPMPTLRDVLLH